MNKLLFVLFLLIGVSAKAQYPITQTLGSNTTTTQIKGISGAGSGLKIYSLYSDTTSYNNLTSLDSVAGVFIYTGDNVWVRSSDFKKWSPVLLNPLDVTFISDYHQNGLLVNAVRTLSTKQYNGPVVVTSSIENQTDSAWYRYTVINNVPGKTSGWFISQSDSLNRMVSTGLNPTPDSTKGFQVLFNKNGANLGYRSGSHYLSAVDSVKGVKVDATTKVSITGNSFLFPRLTTAQRTALPTPDEGLAVYDLDLHKLYIWDGTTWQAAW